MKRLWAAVAAVVMVLAAPNAALAGGLTLHPTGFGEHSYSAWKAQQGEPDRTGDKKEALYFQKMTSTATFAAGVAVIKGLEGQPASALTGLAWDHRVDGHCGAGAPRWDVIVDNSTSGRRTVFLGCLAATHTPTGDPRWIHDSYTGTALSSHFLPGDTIHALAIVFDEGNDVGQGFIYLDNIQVNSHIWTSASDNANGQTITQDPTGQSYVSSLINASVTRLFP